MLAGTNLDPAPVVLMGRTASRRLQISISCAVNGADLSGIAIDMPAWELQAKRRFAGRCDVEEVAVRIPGLVRARAKTRLIIWCQVASEALGFARMGLPEGPVGRKVGHRVSRFGY